MKKQLFLPVPQHTHFIKDDDMFFLWNETTLEGWNVCTKSAKTTIDYVGHDFGYVVNMVHTGIWDDCQPAPIEIYRGNLYE